MRGESDIYIYVSMSKTSGYLRMMSSIGIAIDPSVDKETIVWVRIVWVRMQVRRGGLDVFFVSHALHFLTTSYQQCMGNLFGVV